MSVNIGSALESLQQGATNAGRSLVFRADGDFSSTLTLGQIIKGKVLRHYEGSRYAVSFGDREKVVDSALPLKTGELIQGRITRLDDRVHLQRIMDGKASAQQNLNQHFPPGGVAQNRDAVSALFARYQASLSPADQTALNTLQSRLGGSSLVATSALILSKLGLPLETRFIEAIHRVLQHIESGHRGLTADIGAQLLAQVNDRQSESTLVAGLAPLLARLADQVGATQHEAQSNDTTALAQALQSDAEFAAPPGTGDSQADDRQHQYQQHQYQQQWLLGQWLLNSQSEGVVAHRLLRIPLWFGERLVEVSLALFSQRDTAQQQSNDENTLTYRKAVFALDTENLGHVEVAVKAADRHLGIAVSAETLTIAEILGSQLSELASSLTAHGWHVDEIRYQVASEDSGVVQAVVEHFINQDSLSRLM